MSPPKPEGPAEWRDGAWKARVHVPTGELDDKGRAVRRRVWLRLEGIPEHDRQAARIASAMAQARVDDRGYVPAERDLTVAEYFARWLESRKRLASWTNDRSYFECVIRPALGPLPIRAVTSSHLSDFVRSLDTRAAAGEFSAKHAINVWSCVRAIFRDASKNKNRALLVLEENPTLTVPAPDEDAAGEKAKQMLYPEELAALAACAALPLSRRRLWAVLALAGLRSGEARALTWADVDIPHRVVRVHKQDDRTARRRGVVATKGRKARDTTIEPCLVPCLEAMHAESGGRGPLFPHMPAASGDSGICARFRADLLAAGIAREELHVPTKTSLAIRAHDLRASGITWRLARGDSPALVRQETGHADAEVQQAYVRRLRDLGELFPDLPDLGGSPPGALRAAPAPSWPGSGPVARISSRKAEKLVGATGFEPVTACRESTRKASDSHDVTAPRRASAGETRGPSDALAEAVRLAAAAGRWELVSELARELAALRFAADGRPHLRLASRGKGKR